MSPTGQPETRAGETASVFFKSATDRFAKIAPNNPHIRMLEAVSGKKIKTHHSFSDGQSTRAGTRGGSSQPFAYRWTKQMRATDYELFAGKRVGFDATSPRFNCNQIFCGQSLKFEVPGPGQYEDGQSPRPHTTASQPRNKHIKYAVVFNTCEKRFKNTQGSYVSNKGTTHQVGPGSYINTENAMLKKSFNMSMEHSYFL